VAIARHSLANTAEEGAVSAESDRGRCGLALTSIATVAGAALMVLGASCGGSSAAPPADGAITGDAGTAYADPNDHAITINEIMAANALSAKDDTGAAVPWIELYNPTSGDISLHGYALTDDFNQPRRAVLPAGVAVPAGGRLVLWCDGRPSVGPAHVSISLSSAGGSVGLARPDGSFVDRVTYGSQVVDFSGAREPDGASSWVAAEWHASPGAPNPSGSGAPAPAEVASDAPEMIPDAGDISDRILGDDVMPSYELQIADAGIASLRAQPDTWVPAMLVYDGRAYGPIGVNLKGTQSFLPIDSKPAFRVHADQFVDGARFFGLKELYLNNVSTDFSMMHERLAYWSIHQAGGVPASRANHATVTMNGQLLGLYSQVEEPRAQMLSRFFTDSSGPQYTIHYADFDPRYLTGFDPQSGPDDRTLINNLTQALTLAPPATAMAAAAMYTNMHEFNRYWALMVITGHWGAWPYAAIAEPVGANAGTYADPTTKQLFFIPEGTDDTFATADYDFIGLLRSKLPETCVQVPSCYQDFVNQVWEILGKLEDLNWVAENDKIAASIAPLIPMDTRKPYTDADVAMAQQQMRYFVTGRRAYLSKKLPGATGP
jgi:hypothetical protein